MDKLSLFERIADGEDSLTEFKREIESPDAFAAELIAFANTGGGQILVGVDDAGTTVGVDDPQRTEERILNIGRNNCVPPIDLLLEKVDINGLWLPIAVFIIVGTSNAVNLSDGLDGLAGSLAAVAFACYGVIALLQD